ncbi:ABC transporter ATP-binding protein [Sporomusa sp.]|uniref:ABC transporter ATP-binding protein n=1 Tax=Sporomusa sp. TaxID=2078658 RepID=UPI002B6A97EF|nr:ABC transporter ATP-binding protein [Sporomusa sp.]HWR06001.1 ABC transporter ATP-binding protein [Sporomusa sp.]
MELLNVKELTIRFGGLVAVDNVNLTLGVGETLGVIGPNGSGKTTLFNLLSGIYAPTSGSITVNGAPSHGLRPDQVFKLGMARTFQNGRLFWNLNVVENVMMGIAEVRKLPWFSSVFSNGGNSGDKVVQQAMEILSIFGTLLTSQAHKLAKDLPYADRRRLEICRALASEPQILLLDEPSAGMDAVETETLMLDLKKVKNTLPHLSIIVVEHDMDFIKGLVDQVMVLNYGRCIACGLFDDVASNEEVLRAYLGQEVTAC